jgi:peptidoglycan/LPS O-acetylase OafA/YrhL
VSAPPRLPALTGLRFIAALGVVGVHIEWLTSLPPVVRELAATGTSGVYLFFVLSGFVLTYTYAEWFADGTHRRGAFWWARIARIYPLHLLALAVMTVLTVVGGHVSDLLDAYSAPALVVSWLATLVLVQGWLPLPVFYVWNGISWSLTCEAAMYAAFPTLMARLLRKTPTPGAALRLIAVAWLGLCLAAAAGAAGLVLTMMWLGFRPSPTDWFFSPFYMPAVTIWQFIIGCGLGIWHRRGARLSTSARCLIAVGVPLAWLLLAGPLGGAVPALVWPILATACATALIAALASGPTPLTPLLAHPGMVFLGEASYALYLLHIIPISLLAAVIPPGSLPLSLAVVVVAGTIAAACLVHWTVERPAQRALRAWRPVGKLRNVAANR